LGLDLVRYFSIIQVIIYSSIRDYFTIPDYRCRISFTGISGMSYHGGLIVATIFGIIGIKKNKMPLWATVNLGFLAVPLGYSWGRFGNFINGELYGEVTTSPIGMIFPMARDGLLHHPSQLYEMLI
jgi:phosphatidylglycerol:prolipoprotein diacylglycerol transferase